MNKKTVEKKPQKILVFQQNGSGEAKVRGIREVENEQFIIESIAIDQPLPPFIDDSEEYLPNDFQASLVIDSSEY